MRNKKYEKLIIFAVIVILILLFNQRFGWSRYLQADQFIPMMKDTVNRNPVAAALIYMAATVVGCVVLALPGVTFAIIAGLVFGPLLGTVMCTAAASLGAGAAFLAGRYFLRDSIKPVVMKNKHLKKWLFDETGRNEVFVLMITRLVPLFPYNIQNFAYGITDISFGTYMAYSFLFMIPGTAMYTVGSAGIADKSNRILYFTIAAVMAAAVTAFTMYLRKRYVNEDGVAADLDNGTACTQPEKERLSKSSAKLCVSCGRCTASCDFLQKYKLDFSRENELTELAYHCFLCGRCTQVCPQEIDGRAVILDERQRLTAGRNGKIHGFHALQAEKKNYIFHSYKNAEENSKSLLFMGCNFPAFYPRTTVRLMNVMREHQIGTAFDCCGKPLSELGLADDQNQNLLRLRKYIDSHEIEELITVCPNCYYFFKDKLCVNGKAVRIVSIYEKLAELGIGCRADSDITEALFLPCPDRTEQLWLDSLRKFLPESYEIVQEVQCCGLGGCASAAEPELAAGMKEEMKNYLKKNGRSELYVYCASCAGSFARGGIDVCHILPQILETDEKPDIRHSLANRAKGKFVK